MLIMTIRMEMMKNGNGSMKRRRNLHLHVQRMTQVDHHAIRHLLKENQIHPQEALERYSWRWKWGLTIVDQPVIVTKATPNQHQSQKRMMPYLMMMKKKQKLRNTGKNQ